MNCPQIQPELVAYHFGTVSAEERQEIEQHLLGCQDCLRAYLALKREIETAEAGPRPSSAARDRLRRAVAQELTRGEQGRGWAWWERPLAFGLAGAAVFAAVVAMHVLASSAGSLPHSFRDESEQSDTLSRIR